MRKLGDASRMLVAAGVIAVPGATLGFSLGGPDVALGASVGILAAGLYAWSFLRSHVSRTSRKRVFDRRVAAGAGLRLVTAAVTGAAMFLVGRKPFVAYLAAFGAAFAILLLTQAPGALRQLQRPRVDESADAHGQGGMS
ncbi:MAG: hypothetical protein ACRDJF_03115 [Actinomycetota bacterium]